MNATASVKMQQQMQTITQVYLTFCQKHGLNERKYDDSLRMCILLSLRAVNRQAIFNDMQGDIYVDWAQFENNEKDICVFGNAALTWVTVLRCFDPHVFTQKVDENETIPDVLKRFNARLKTCGFDCQFSQVSFLFLLCNVNRITMTHAMTAFFRSSTENVDHSQAIKTFVMQQADERADSRDYERALAYILRKCVLLPQFESQVAQLVQSQLALRSMLTQKQTQVLSGRPRLRERLRNMTMERLELTDPAHITQMSQDSFNGWCTRVRFPNNVSVPLRQKLYFLMCMDPVYEACASELIKSMVDAALAEKIIAVKVSQPECGQIQSVITRLTFYREPFSALTAFRVVVASGLSLQKQAELTYAKIMQLYVAVYQREGLWQDCWKALLPVLNHTIISNVQKFVKENEFNTDAFGQLLNDN
jgi:hypothetical protein